jgi:Na+/H+ antiporter NhaA
VSQTGWASRARTPLREFLHTETGSAVILVAAAVAALIWANASPGSYSSFWHAHLGGHAGRFALEMDAREFVNAGLMTFFFLIIGLETRREFDMGELRERSRLALPLAAGLGGMVLSAVLYLVVSSDHAPDAWGVTISTDTAFALGALALVGRSLPDRVRTFLLTISVVDDLTVIIVIAVFYSEKLDVEALIAGLMLLAAMLVLRWRGVRNGFAYLLTGLSAWVAFFASGVDPILVGLVFGLISVAYPASRSQLREASSAYRAFRTQPTPEHAQAARTVVRTAISPNDRLMQLFHPWSSYFAVPVFALANTGITLNPSFLARAYASPVTLGIIVGYLAGKPAGTVAGSWLICRLTGWRLKPPVGWGGVAGVGTASGIGFTIALLIADKALHGSLLDDAKLGILTAAVGASLLTWLAFRVVAMMPPQRRLQSLYGTAHDITDLAVAVDRNRDHIRGPELALVTLVEYADFECDYCAQAEPVIGSILESNPDVRLVFRHLPLEDVHPDAYRAALAAEAAARQGKFWEMHDLLFARQDALSARDLVKHAAELGLDAGRFVADMRSQAGAERIAADVDSADMSGVSGIPGFFINGIRFTDAAGLADAVATERARARLRSLSTEPGHGVRSAPEGDRAERPVLTAAVGAAYLRG